MTEPYRPSNGTEGEIFMAKFCENCIHDGDDPPCAILGAALFTAIDDKGYPEEWVRDSYGKNERCTAFVPKDGELPQPRCEKTLEMF